MTDHAQVMTTVEETRVRLGLIERLIANAGEGEPTFVDTFSAAHIEKVFALNVSDVAHCIEAVLPDMLQRGSGHIVAVSSVAVFRGLPGSAAYSVAKAGLSAMIESLRIDLRRQDSNLLNVRETIAWLWGRRRKYVKRYGKRALRKIDRYFARQSLAPNTPVLDTSLFPWAAEFEGRWRALRAELDALLLRRQDLPRFQDISPDQKRISQDDKWRTFSFYGFG